MRDGSFGRREGAGGDFRDVDGDSIGRWLAEIKHFQQETLPEFRRLLSKSSASKGELIAIYNKVKRMEIFQPQSYFSLQYDQQLNHLVEHDLGNLATPAVSARIDLSFVKEGEDDNEGLTRIHRTLTHAMESMLSYSFILEDLLLRKCGRADGGLVSQSRRELDWKDVLDAVGILKESGAVDGLVKRKLRIEVNNPTELVKSNESVETIPGVIVNSVFNIIRNGSKDGVGAKKVVFSIVRDNDDLVFKVVNDGKAMERGKIDKSNKEGAIYYGHSYTNGTGLGLGGILDRMEMAGAELDVQSQENDKKAETIFEIRLPITKKE